MTIKDIRPEDDVPALLENITRVTSGLDRAGVWRHRKKDGTTVFVEITSHTNSFDGRDAELVMVSDITGRVEAEMEKEKIQGQLLQAQKIESVGRLAGGVAHKYRPSISQARLVEPAFSSDFLPHGSAAAFPTQSRRPNDLRASAGSSRVLEVSSARILPLYSTQRKSLAGLMAILW